jgi:hypothetical protein
MLWRSVCNKYTWNLVANEVLFFYCLFKLFLAFSWMCNICCFDDSLVSSFTYELQVSWPVTRMVCNPSLGVFAHRWTFSESTLPKPCAGLAYPNCGLLMVNNAWNMWKLTLEFGYCEAPTSTDLWSTLWSISSLTTNGRLNISLFIVNNCSPCWTSYTSVLYFLHSWHFGAQLTELHC